MRKLLLMACAVALLTACEKPIVSDEDTTGTVVVDDEGNAVPTKKFTFTIKGDFSDTWKQTRGYLQADGKDMTDVWVFDYIGDELQQQIHLTNTDENWATPSINLAMGTHNIYFVASRGTTPTVNTTNKTITWAKPSDTFWKDYEVTVVSTSNGNRAVTLDRVATRFRATVTDAIPTGCASITIAPASWHTGLNYQTGVPITAVTDYTTVINIPGSSDAELATKEGVQFKDYWQPRITQIIERYLGKGHKVKDCTRDQVEALDLILTDLRELVQTTPPAAKEEDAETTEG
jgi:hypothetical protein